MRIHLTYREQLMSSRHTVTIFAITQSLRLLSRCRCVSQRLPTVGPSFGGLGLELDHDVAAPLLLCATLLGCDGIHARLGSDDDDYDYHHDTHQHPDLLTGRCSTYQMYPSASCEAAALDPGLPSGHRRASPQMRGMKISSVDEPAQE